VPAVSEARIEILRRIRAAIGESPEVPVVPRDYRPDAGYAVEALREVLTDRLVDYRARVVPCGEGRDEIGAAVAEVLTEQGLRSVVAPPRVAQEWLAGPASGQDVQVVADEPGLGAHDLDGIDAVVTGAALAIAETGVIVLDGDEWCGRRAISLVPDTHVCVVRMEQVVGLPPEAIRRLDPRRPQTWIAGPSATSDIELDRVEGVHGPRTLVVVLAG
jgi:L-lactate dehydrogenase complex protein LldG